MSIHRKTSITYEISRRMVAEGISLRELKAAIEKQKWRLMHKVVRDVALARNISEAVILGPCRSRYAMQARSEAMAALYESGHFTLTAIGDYFGGRNHATVLHAIARNKRDSVSPSPKP